MILFSNILQIVLKFVCIWPFQVALVVKNPAANAGDVRLGFDLWVRKIP